MATISGIVLSNTKISADCPVGAEVGTITVTMSDGSKFDGTLTLSGPFISAFSISAVRDPYWIASMGLSGSTVVTGQPADTVIGTIAVAMSDASPFSGQLSVDDTTHFAMSGHDLVTSSVITQAGSLSVTITAAQTGCANYSQAFPITVQQGQLPVPGAPANLAVVSKSNTTVTLSFGPPSTGAALDAGKYQVEYKAHSSGVWLNGPSIPYCTKGYGSFTDGYNNVWSIAASNVPQINGTATDPYSHTELLLLVGGTIWQYDLLGNWYGTTPTGFIPSGGSLAWAAAGTTSPLSSVTVSGLTQGTPYDFDCWVSNSGGNGTPCAAVQATTDTVSVGPGPSASSSFLLADFAIATGKTVYPQLFGLSTGGLANNSEIDWLSKSHAPGNWADFKTYPLLRQRIRALNAPMIRINSLWMSRGTFDGPYMLDNLLNNIAEGFPSSTVWVWGIGSGESMPPMTYQGYYDFTRAFCDYWRNHAPAGYKISYVECNGERNDWDRGTYNSCFSGMVAGAQSIDPTIKGTGSVDSYFRNDNLSSLIQSQNANTLGMLDWHGYQYAQDGVEYPSDYEVMTGAAAPNDISNTFGPGNLGAVENGTYAVGMPGFMGEWNVEAWAKVEPRTQTNLGAGYMFSTLLKGAAKSVAPAYAGVWDPYRDGTYSLINDDDNFTPTGQYYALQNLVRAMPGVMVSTTTGNGNVLAWATKSGSKLGLAIVNANSSIQTGNIALSHWPVNSSGNASLTMWQMDGSNYTSGGVTVHPTASSGILPSVSLSPMSVTTISYP